LAERKSYKQVLDVPACNRLFTQNILIPPRRKRKKEEALIKASSLFFIFSVQLVFTDFKRRRRRLGHSPDNKLRGQDNRLYKRGEYHLRRSCLRL